MVITITIIITTIRIVREEGHSDRTGWRGSLVRELETTITQINDKYYKDHHEHSLEKHDLPIVIKLR